MAQFRRTKDQLKSLVSATMFWVLAVFLLGAATPAYAQFDGFGSDVAARQKIEIYGDRSWSDVCLALAADDKEELPEPSHDLAEAGDGFDLKAAGFSGRSSARLAIGLASHPTFADRPEARGMHARGPPLMLFNA